MNWKKILLWIAIIIFVPGLVYFCLIKYFLKLDITSWWRSYSKNKQIGGTNRSQHLIGWGFDIIPATENNNKKLQKIGLHTLNEGDHIHAQIFPKL